MRKLGLLQLSRQLIVANDNTSGVPTPAGPAPPITSPEHPPTRTRDAPDPARVDARGRMTPATRSRAANPPPHRALRPRRRS
jgi:hypothetical protein